MSSSAGKKKKDEEEKTEEKGNDRESAPSTHPDVPSSSSTSSTDRRPSTGSKAHGEKNIFSRFVESFEEALHLTSSHQKLKQHKLTETTVDGIVEFIQAHKPKNVVVMTGAGISTSAGIPDFRSPGTGLYENLQEYNLSDPMDIFALSYFHKNPEPFYQVAKKLFPKHIKPTPTHHFVRLLEKKGILRRWFTQNIDALEHMTGMPEEKIVEAHGSHRKSTCLKCKKKYDLAWMEAKLADESVKVPKCESCEGVIKPDITFFGENLPKRFFQCCISDFPKCDFLIIMGTSLVVQPFAGLVHEVGDDVPRLLINLEPAGRLSKREMAAGVDGLCYGHKGNTRDVFWKSPCDAAVKEFAERLGWENEFQELLNEAEIAFEDRLRRENNNAASL